MKQILKSNKRNKSTKLALLVFFLFITASFSQMTAQVNEGEVVDKIIAVVGNEIIMLSDLNGQIAKFAQQDRSIDPNDKQFRQRVLDAMINEKLVVTKAIEDSITVTEDEIKESWNRNLQYFVSMYGSEKRVEDVYGMSISRLFFEFKDDVRKQILVQKLQGQKFEGVKANPREVQDFFQSYKDSLPEIPAKVELCHIVKNVEANKSAKEEVLDLAKKVRDSILKGANFADFAAKYSQDFATASSGGELGWFEKDKLFPEYEKAAFALMEGQISMPVETPFGFHLIQTLSKRKDSVLTRHILFKIGQSALEQDSIKNFLLELKYKCEKGESFEELAKLHSDEKETQGFGGSLGKFPVNQIPANLKDIIDKLKDGEVSDPYPYSTEPKLSFHIIFRKKTIAEHKPGLDSDYSDIEDFATNYKKQKLYQEWIDQLRKTMYWEVKQ